MGNRGGPQMQFSMMVPVTPVVKALLIINIAVWVILQLIIGKMILGNEMLFTHLLGLVPNNLLHNFFVWEPLTYMFLHALNPFHILFNMLLLWWLGAELEQRWGSKFFLAFYLVSGVGAALLYSAAIFIYSFFGGVNGGVWVTPVVGASGAIFGLMLAYGVIFGERVVYFMMVFPMRAKYFVMILGAVEVVTLMNNGFGSDVANLAHVGGIVSGFIFLQIYTRLQQRRWRKQSDRRGRGLRLVVNNDRDDGKNGPKGGPEDGNNGPRYWN